MKLLKSLLGVLGKALGSLVFAAGMLILVWALAGQGIMFVWVLITQRGSRWLSLGTIFVVGSFLIFFLIVGVAFAVKKLQERRVRNDPESPTLLS